MIRNMNKPYIPDSASTSFETYLQWEARVADEVMHEYQVPRKEALETVKGYGATMWWALQVEHLDAGKIPSQAWINSIRTHNDMAWKSYLKFHYQVFENIAKAGRMVFFHKNEKA